MSAPIVKNAEHKVKMDLPASFAKVEDNLPFVMRMKGEFDALSATVINMLSRQGLAVSDSTIIIEDNKNSDAKAVSFEITTEAGKICSFNQSVIENNDTYGYVKDSHSLEMFVSRTDRTWFSDGANFSAKVVFFRHDSREGMQHYGGEDSKYTFFKEGVISKENWTSNVTCDATFFTEKGEELTKLSIIQGLWQVVSISDLTRLITDQKVLKRIMRESD